MALTLNIEGDVKRITRQLGRFPVESKKAAVTAMNRTTRKVTTQVKRAIASDVGIPQKFVSPKLRSYPATRLRLESKSYAGLKYGVPLIRVVGGGRRKKTLTAIPKRVRTRYLKSSLDGRSSKEAFTARVGAGHLGFFVRKRTADRARGRDSKGRLRRGRLPIQEVKFDFTESAVRRMPQIGNRVAPIEFPREFTRDLKRRLNLL